MVYYGIGMSMTSVAEFSLLVYKITTEKEPSNQIRVEAFIVKVGFFQKVMAKFSNLSNCHSCEPKIVPALLIPVNDNNKILAIL